MDFLFERLARLAALAPENMPCRTEVLARCQRQVREGASLEEASGNLLDVARILRATRKLGSDAYCYVVGWVVEHLAEPAIQRIYQEEFAPRFAAIERTYKMRPNWEFREGQEPPEYVAVSREFERRVTDITAAKLREYTEPVLAEMVERDRAGFQAIRTAGRIDLLGPDAGPALIAV